MLRSFSKNALCIICTLALVFGLLPTSLAFGNAADDSMYISSNSAAPLAANKIIATKSSLSDSESKTSTLEYDETQSTSSAASSAIPSNNRENDDADNTDTPQTSPDQSKTNNTSGQTEHANSSSSNMAAIASVSTISDETQVTNILQDAVDAGDPSLDNTPTDPSTTDPSATEPPKEYLFALGEGPTITEITQTSQGLLISWTRKSNITGYIILRRKIVDTDVVDPFAAAFDGKKLSLVNVKLNTANLQTSGWSWRKTTTSNNTISWTDTKADPGVEYEYVVLAYKKSSDASINNSGLSYLPEYSRKRAMSLPSKPVTAYRVPRPQITSSSKSGGTNLSVTWTALSGVEGYQLQYSTTRLFLSKVTRSVSGSGQNSILISNLKNGTPYYVRIRSYTTFNGETLYSPWATCSATSALTKGTIKRLGYYAKKKIRVKVKSKKKSSRSSKSAKSSKKKFSYKTKTIKTWRTFDLRTRAGQRMGGYDTMQGGCSDGTYMYFCLLNKNRNRTKIAKVRIKTMRVVKLSSSYAMSHSNGITYNATTNRLVVAHGKGAARTFTQINASTLKRVNKVTVSKPSYLVGASANQAKTLSNGYGDIAYCKERNQYVAMLRNTHNFVILDANFKPVRFIENTYKNWQIYQGLEVTDDHIIIIESPKYSSHYNIITMYSWDGAYVSRTRLTRAYEAENLFFAGDKLYAGFYRSYSSGRHFMRAGYVYRITKH